MPAAQPIPEAVTNGRLQTLRAQIESLPPSRDNEPLRSSTCHAGIASPLPSAFFC